MAAVPRELGGAVLVEPCPAMSEVLGPAMLDELGPAMSEELGPVTSEELGPATSEEPGPATSEELGPATSEELGPALSEELCPTLPEELVPTVFAIFCCIVARRFLNSLMFSSSCRIFPSLDPSSPSYEGLSLVLS